MQNIISNIIQDKQAIKNQLGTPADIVKVPFRFEEIVKPKYVVTKLVARQVSGAGIWGSPSFGIWGTMKWGDVTGSAFVLNSSSFGILGTAKLGSGGSSSLLYAVLPNNNIFTEYFGANTFISTNSTGTLNTANETYTLTAGQFLESEVICKLRSPINSVALTSLNTFINTGNGMIFPFTLGGSSFGNDNSIIEVSNDSGTTWINITQNNKLLFPTSTAGDELKYRITALSGLTISPPLYLSINK